MHTAIRAVALSRAALGLSLAFAVASHGGPGTAAGRVLAEDVFVVSVDNVSAKVGERTALVARVSAREGYRIADAYRNRIGHFSSYDEGVAFEAEVVRAVVEDGILVFTIGVTPTKPGAHPINGLFRVSAADGENLRIMSVPLIATVTGLE